MRNLSIFTRTVAVIAASTLATPVAAYDLKPIVVQLTPSGAGASQSMVVTNSHDVPIAIEVHAFKRQQLSSGEDKLSAETDDIIIYPPQMVIAPKSSQSFKVQWVGDPAPKQELAYRIVTEQLPIKFKQEARGDRTADVTVRYRYEAALYVSPKGASPSARLAAVKQVKGDDGSAMLEMTIRSEGTARAILDKPTVDLRDAAGRSTSLSGEAVAPLDGLNILPGVERVVRLPAPEGLAAGPLTGSLNSKFVVLQ